jgi:putative phosphoribosyl transferase
VFANRTEAGLRLAERLEEYRGRDDVVVVGLPRGGVPVAMVVARVLGVALDVIVVRKLGIPFQPEVAMGAIGEGGVRVVDDRVVRQAGVTVDQLATVEAHEHEVLDERSRRFRAVHPMVSLAHKVVIVVDDGVATGSTARAACAVARAHAAQRVVLAVPVAPEDWAERLGTAADRYVAVATPRRFRAVGCHYRDFAPTTDDEVVGCLRTARRANDAVTDTASDASTPDRPA